MIQQESRLRVADNTGARALYESMGFREHHRSRYVRADDLLAHT